MFAKTQHQTYTALETIPYFRSACLAIERLTWNRPTQQKRSIRLFENGKQYLPPCYYTTNAFSNQNANVWHNHPFQGANASPIIDKLPQYTVFTWPFRLSFNFSKSKKKTEGDYPPDLEQRIDRFRKKFSSSGESFVFFYLNYDNPISADDSNVNRNHYVLVGCALISEVGKPEHFITDSRLA